MAPCHCCSSCEPLDSSYPRLSTCSCLERLAFTSTPLDSATLTALRPLTSLTALDLAGEAKSAGAAY